MIRHLECYVLINGLMVCHHMLSLSVLMVFSGNLLTIDFTEDCGKLPVYANVSEEC